MRSSVKANHASTSCRRRAWSGRSSAASATSTSRARVSSHTVATASAHSLARTIEVNLIGSMLTAHAALPAITERKGHVLLISSAAAFTVLPGMSAYCAAKAGLEWFGDALRLEVAHRGVTVASAHPTWIDTDLVRDTEEALPTFRVPQLERDIAALNGREFGRNSVGVQPKDEPAA
jgi:NAD(P)-dependent dehydrogenase (short-subunit alcohol dehydrogenase family)